MKFWIFMIPTLMIMIFFLIEKLTSKKMFQTNMSINSPFECGFNNQSKMRSSFSHFFFTTTILFVILEMEIILIIPFNQINYKSNINNWCFFMTMLLLMILMMKEWKNKMISWSK